MNNSMRVTIDDLQSKCGNMTVALIDDLHSPLTQLQQQCLFWLFCVLVCVTILGNMFSLSTLYVRRSQYRVLYKACLVSQNMSDLLMGCFVGVDSLARFTHPDIAWRLGSFMCNWQPFITTATVLVSSMTLTCIAFDRYQGIILLREKWDPKVSVSVLTVSSIWVASAGISVPLYLGYHTQTICFIDCVASSVVVFDLCLTTDTREKNNDYYTTVFAIIFLPLLAAFIGLYSAIANYMWIKSKPKARSEASSNTQETNTNTTAEVTPVGPTPVTPASRSNEKKSRIFKIILMIMGTFIVCRLPQWIFIILSTNPSVSLTSNESWVVKYLLSALSLFNSAINPFIYSFLNQVISLRRHVQQGFNTLCKHKHVYTVKQ